MYTALADPSYVNATIKYDSLDSNSGRSAFLSVEFIQLFSWHVSMNNDITLKRNLTVTEAFMGTNIAVDIERTIIDESCEVQVCSICKGSKCVQAKSKDFFDPILIQTIIAPCPACVGLGIVTYNGCNTFKIVKEHINVAFPRGCRPGYEMVLKSSGNAYFQDNNFLMGDLRVIIQSVENDNFIVNKDHVSLTLLLTPHEAVNGFIYETLYISDEILRVERTNKITIPGSEIRLQGLGLPLFSAANISTVNLQREHRDDLIIHFELEEDIDDENDEINENQITPSGSGILELNSQEIFDNIIEKMNKKRENRVLRNMLLFLMKQNAPTTSY